MTTEGIGESTHRSSLSVSQNSKGQFQISGKVYAQDGVENDFASELESTMPDDPGPEHDEMFKVYAVAHTILSRNRYLESLVDLDGARKELTRQIKQVAEELRRQGFTVAGDA